jgi:hypothetical protein
MELGRLVLPALVGKTIEPVALLLETAFIGKFIGTKMDGLKNQEIGLVSLIPGCNVVLLTLFLLIYVLPAML